MKQPPKFLWDAAYLENLESQLGGEMGDNMVILCLSPISFRMLAEMSEMVLWPSRYVDRELPNFAYRVYAELNNGCFDMSKLDELIEVIKNMSVNIVQNNGCGCGGSSGSGGSGNVTVVNQIEYPNRTGNELPQLPPNLPIDDPVNQVVPDGFDSYADYRSYKCGVATSMFDDFRETIGNFQSLGGIVGAVSGYALANVLGSAIVGEALIVGLMAAGVSVTGGLIVIVLALVGVAVLGAVAFSYFNDIFDDLTANRETYICALFNATTEAEARAVFYDSVNVAVVNLAVTDGVKDNLNKALLEIVDALIPSELLISLFKFVDAISQRDFDCSTCDQLGQATAVFPFDLGLEGWERSSLFDTCRWADTANYGNQGGVSMWTRDTDDGYLRASYNNALSPQTGVASSVSVVSISFDTWKQAGANHRLHIIINEGEASEASAIYNPEDIPVDYANKVRRTATFNTALVDLNNTRISFRVYRSELVSNLAVFVDNVEIVVNKS